MIAIDTPCMIPFNVKPAWDGYVRVPHPTKRREDGRKCTIGLHKLTWEECHGEVPKGFELHHLCHNRACYNIKHLVLLSSSDHAKLHDLEKYGDRKQKAKEYWKTHQGITGTKLGEMFGVSFSMGCRWIREWRKSN